MIEESAGTPLTVLFVGVSAVTGGAVLRVAARVFGGFGPRPAEGQRYETSGEGEEPETGAALARVPVTMLAVPALLLAAALAAGLSPALAHAVGDAVDRAVPGAAAHEPRWPAPGILLGLLSTALAGALAARAVRRPARTGGRDLMAPLRRLHSGHIGDYVAWLAAGATLLAALTRW